MFWELNGLASSCRGASFYVHNVVRLFVDDKIMVRRGLLWLKIPLGIIVFLVGLENVEIRFVSASGT